MHFEKGFGRDSKMKNIFSVGFFIKKNGQKGSVTIFLTMILVPMLLLMITLTDYARISVAKRQVSGAGDVALNAGLSYYDKRLQDMYGLFAVSKNTDDLEDNLEVYFQNTLLGEGIDTTDPFISKIVNIITGNKGSEDAYMNLINLTSREFELSGIDNANLANTALLNNQIMDYMKYRGPVVLLGGIFDKIGAFKGVNKENKAIQKKAEFEEELDKTGDKCAKAYKKIKAYNDTIQKYNFNADKITHFKEEMTELYKKIITGMFLISKNEFAEPKESKISILDYHEDYSSYTIEDLKNLLKSRLDSSGYTDKFNNHKALNAADGDFVNVAKYIYSYNDLVEYFNKNIRVPGDTFLDLLEDFEANLDKDEELSDISKEIEEYIKYTNEFGEGFEWESLKSILPKPSELVSYTNVLKDYFNNFKSYTEYNNGQMLEKIEKRAIKYYKYELEDGYEESGKEDEIKDYVKELGKKWDRYKGRHNKLKNDLDSYKGIKDRYNKNLDYFLKNKSGSLYDEAHHKRKAAINAIDNNIKEANDKKKEIDKQINEIIKAAKKAKKAVKDIIDAFGVLEGKRDSWQGQIDTLSGGSKASMQADLKSEAGNIDKKQAEKCKENLEKICKKLEDLKKDIDKFKFDKSKAEKAAKNCEGEDIDGERKPAADNYYNTVYGSLSIDTNNVPGEIDKEHDKFFGYLKKLYGENGNDSYKRNDEGEKEAEEEAKEKEETKDELLEINSSPDQPVKTQNGTSGELVKEDLTDINTSVKSTYASPVLPSVEKHTADEKPDNTNVDSGNISGSIGNAANSSILSGIMSFSEKCVEDIYLTEYVMNMFTYRTYNRNPDGSAIEDAGLKTLSNCAYTAGILKGAEAEYVLWGRDTKKKNLDATYITIFGIRFLMNTIYAFTDNEIKAETLAAATAIAGWTGFGIPIVKTALTVGLALLESKLDLDALIKGKSVSVYKDKNTWICSLSGFANQAASELINVATEKAQEAASYAIDKIHNCAAENIKELSEDMTKSLQDMTRNTITTIVNDVTSAIENKIMGIFDYGVDYASMEKDEIQKEIKNWTTELKTILGVPYSQPSSKENVPDYLLYKVYNEVIKTEDFINKVTDEIWNNYRDAKTSEAENLIKELEGKVYKMCGIKKSKNKDGEEEIIEVFGINTNEFIEDAISSVNGKVQGYLDKGTEAAKEEVSKVISGYSNSLQNSLHKKPAATGGVKGTSSKSLASSITMDYSEYLTMFLLVTGVSKDKYKNHLLRVADLIQINTGIAKGDNKFALKNCKTHLKIHAVASGSTFFAGSTYLQKTKDIYLHESNGLYGINYNGVDGY